MLAGPFDLVVGTVKVVAAEGVAEPELQAHKMSAMVNTTHGAPPNRRESPGPRIGRCYVPDRRPAESRGPFSRGSSWLFGEDNGQSATGPGGTTAMMTKGTSEEDCEEQHPHEAQVEIMAGADHVTLAPTCSRQVGGVAPSPGGS